jgi:hypothetical protein
LNALGLEVDRVDVHRHPPAMMADAEAALRPQ